MQNNTCTSPTRPSKAFLNGARTLVLIVLTGVMLVASMSAQPLVAANTKTGKILGTVVDTTEDPIPGATVVLQGPAGDRLTAVTKDDGAFVFDQAPAEGIDMGLHVVGSLAQEFILGKFTSRGKH